MCVKKLKTKYRTMRRTQHPQKPFGPDLDPLPHAARLLLFRLGPTATAPALEYARGSSPLPDTSS